MQIILLYTWLAGALYVVVRLGQITTNLVTSLARLSNAFTRVIEGATNQLQSAASQLTAAAGANPLLHSDVEDDQDTLTDE